MQRTRPYVWYVGCSFKRTSIYSHSGADRNCAVSEKLDSQAWLCVKDCTHTHTDDDDNKSSKYGSAAVPLTGRVPSDLTRGSKLWTAKSCALQCTHKAVVPFGKRGVGLGSLLSRLHLHLGCVYRRSRMHKRATLTLFSWCRTFSTSTSQRTNRGHTRPASCRSHQLLTC